MKPTSFGFLTWIANLAIALILSLVFDVSKGFIIFQPIIAGFLAYEIKRRWK